MSQELTVSLAPLSAKPTGIAVIYVAEGKVPADAGGALWAETGLDWAKLSDLAAFKGKTGQEVDVLAPANLAADRLLVLGAGKAGEGAAPLTAWADRGGALTAKLAARKATQVSVIVEGADVTPEAIAELAAGLHLRHYKFDKYKSGRKGDDAEPKPLAVTLHVAEPAAAEKALAERLAVVAGTLLARDLVNEPANVLGTLEFADRASKLSALGVQIQILDEKAMADLGMNSLLAVSKGSVRPPRLVIMRWNGTDPTAQPVAFIGKGVVFDTGGISIKPAANMEDMKGDMGGAAAVTGLMHALAARKARVNAVGIIGLVENMPDGNATRPGDIVTAMSGTTIEVINTDAEGRLVLADALWYAQDRFKPRFMINLATLTGAILVALGQDHAGLFSNNDALSQNLLAAGLASNEKLWRMPMGPAYDKMIESRFADIKNSAGRHAGSITAAHFLSRFVNDVPWAHLDIAGTAMAAPSSDINTSWGSGFGVALLNRLVKDYYEG